MIKIEVRIKHTVDNLSIEREYRAELPDTATAEQIAAVGKESGEKIPVTDSEPTAEPEATLKTLEDFIVRK